MSRPFWNETDGSLLQIISTAFLRCESNRRIVRVQTEGQCDKAGLHNS